ncbi:MAG: ABC transporter permease [Lachnospiraceae bacterium]|nr:ABC transporter permease [Lachnospiraceae bacterium]
MKKIILNFLKADVRMPQLMFWDWMFPVILIVVIGIFVGKGSLSTFLFPGFLAFFLMQSIIFSIPYRLAQFNETGILRFIREKGSVGKLLFGFYGSRFFIILIQMAIVLLVGKLAMKVEFTINAPIFVLAFVMTLVVFFIIATIIGMLTKTQNAALGLSQAVYFVLIGVSGIVYPLDKSPALLVAISHISPLRYIHELWQIALYNQASVDGLHLLILLAMSAIGGLIIFQLSKSRRDVALEGCAQN